MNVHLDDVREIIFFKRIPTKKHISVTVTISDPNKILCLSEMFRQLPKIEPFFDPAADRYNIAIDRKTRKPLYFTLMQYGMLLLGDDQAYDSSSSDLWQYLEEILNAEEKVA